MNRPRRTVVTRSAGRAAPAVRRGAVALAVAAATAVVAGPSAVRATDGDNHIAVTVVSNPTAVTSGDDVQYVVTASNKNTTSNSRATTLTDTIACSPSGACGTITAIAQTAGPDAWSCRVVSSTEGVCELPSGMANKAEDTFSVIAQTATALDGTMTDTAKVDTVDVGGVSSSAASATTTVTAADDTGGGTTTGFCPNTGCTISSGGEPSANGTVGAITFPPFTGSGFIYSFSLSPGSFCGTSVVACTGLTMETGPLAGPGPGQTFTASDPVVVNLVYGPGITPSSPDSLTTLAFKSDTASGPGTLIPSCGSPVVTPCARPASRDGAGALVTTILMSSGDPRVGNLYIP